MAMPIPKGKETFLKQHVFRAARTDKFYDKKCSFCWSQYDKTHSAVRVQPCHHIFGRECLYSMINSQGGHLCPICRSILFNPPPKCQDPGFSGQDTLLTFLIKHPFFHGLVLVLAVVLFAVFILACYAVPFIIVQKVLVFFWSEDEISGPTDFLSLFWSLERYLKTVIRDSSFSRLGFLVRLFWAFARMGLSILEI
ncbi:hypothetical protein BDV96DRAFT_77017 [Lophiotrema nucula]|uniref:RING-type domain-containing protein n=1 Tax=Lophiotrema nucula TaxID=690887 RepID=A0A6A5Z7T5_9PLEO|nr:hypothetical protein BDV96DRAFT_77017 [Lophiotrema nucula]